MVGVIPVLAAVAAVTLEALTPAMAASVLAARVILEHVHHKVCILRPRGSFAHDQLTDCAKVAHLGYAPLIDENVARLEVAVHFVAAVNVRHARCNVEGDLIPAFQGQRKGGRNPHLLRVELSRNQTLKAAAGHELKHQKWDAIIIEAGAPEAHNILVARAHEKLCLLGKIFFALWVSHHHRGLEDLHSDGDAVPDALVNLTIVAWRCTIDAFLELNIVKLNLPPLFEVLHFLVALGIEVAVARGEGR